MIQVDKYDVFLTFCKALFNNFPKKIAQIMEPEEAMKPHLPTAEPLIRKSVDSLKSIPHCCHYFLIINSMFEERPKKLIESLIPQIVHAIYEFPANILPLVKNMPLYIE